METYSLHTYMGRPIVLLFAPEYDFDFTDATGTFHTFFPGYMYAFVYMDPENWEADVNSVIGIDPIHAMPFTKEA